ncbi:MAG: nucleotidyltransferase family protein [Candidatus Levybacteria bacterium]|nr:nucleotidyltransferase family protein [Candidatus Levybacteria bacterium]
MNKKDIISLIEKDKWMIDVLKIVGKLNLSDWWVGAGFVRGKVWDSLHGYRKRTPLPDIDVVYFDKKDFDKIEAKSFSTKAEERYQEVLKKKMPKINWSVTNQARMHLMHNDKPYKNSEEGLSNWVETATCIGVRIKNGKLILATPIGIKDLVNLILRPTPKFKKDLKVFKERMKTKKTLKKWPKLKVVF